MTSRILLLAGLFAAAAGSALAQPAPPLPPGQVQPAVPPTPYVAPVARPPITKADYTNSVGMDFMRIRAGTMLAGAYEPCVIMPPDPTPRPAAAPTPP
ncbi:MAG: hypothetical protein J0I28_03985, partial [Caulobacterales bacterium]|nr:hypothetical protein [Caulobacterales bacterium]